MSGFVSPVLMQAGKDGLDSVVSYCLVVCAVYLILIVDCCSFWLSPSTFCCLCQVREMSIDYSNCMSTDGNSTCSDLRRQNRTLDSMAIPCICNQQFTISEDWTGTVYVYYRLTEFYQNHRRYLKSVNQEQLQGSTSKTSGCTPNAFTSTDDVPILPCGMIANSKFNGMFCFNTTQRYVCIFPFFFFVVAVHV